MNILDFFLRGWTGEGLSGDGPKRKTSRARADDLMPTGCAGVARKFCRLESEISFTSPKLWDRTRFKAGFEGGSGAARYEGGRIVSVPSTLAMLRKKYCTMAACSAWKGGAWPDTRLCASS